MWKIFYGRDVYNDLSFPFHTNFTLLNQEFPMHSHDFSEIVVVLHGRSKHIVNNVEYDLSAGDIYIIRKETEHAFLSAQNCQICNIQFDPSNFLFPTDDLMKMQGYQVLFILEPNVSKSLFKSRMRLSIDKLKYVKQLTNEMYNEQEQKPEAYKTRIVGLFTEFVVFICREYSNQQVINADLVKRLSDTVAYLEMNYLKPMKLEDVADIAFVSPSHLCRIFKEAFMISPMEYVTKLRIEHACQLLKYTKKSITEISYECGFNDNNYFSRRFRIEYGLTPMEYRVCGIKK